MEEELLTVRCVWAGGMAMVFGLALSSVRRNTDREASAGWVAMALSLAGVVAVLIWQAEGAGLLR